MKFKLSQPLNFIQRRKPSDENPILEGYIEILNGQHCIVSGEFKQFIKASQYRQIIENSVAPADEEANQQFENVETAIDQTNMITQEAPAKGRGTRRK